MFSNNNPKSVNFKFFTLSLFLFIIHWFITTIPIVNRVIIHYTGINILGYFGSNSPSGPKKILIFQISALFSVLLLCFTFIYTWKTHERWKRFVTLMTISALILISLKWPEQVRYDRFRSIRIESYSNIDYNSIFNKKYFQFDVVSSTDDFYHLVHNRFLKYEDHLNSRWHLANSRLLESIFYMNTVSALWKYSKCISTNSDLSNSHSKIKFYLSQNEACCTDFALTLKLLLDKAKFKNRLVLLPGHIFNEVLIQNNWYTLDASINVMFNQPWKNIAFTNGNTIATTFVHLNLNPINNANYSPSIGALRYEQKYWAMEKATLFFKYEDRNDFWLEPLMSSGIDKSK